MLALRKSPSTVFLLGILTTILAWARPASATEDYHAYLHPVASYEVNSRVADAILHRDHVIVPANSGDEIRIVDCRDRSALREVASINTTGGVKDFSLEGDLLYVTASLGESLLTVDVSNPANPVKKQSRATDSYTYGIDRDGAYVYVGTYTGLEIYRASDLVLVGSIDLGTQIEKVQASGGIVVCMGYYVYVIDARTPTAPVLATRYDARYNRNVHFDGRYLHLSQDGYKIVDLQDPENPVDVGLCEGINYFDLAVEGGYAYLTDHDDGIRILDVQDPAHPVLVGQVRGFESYGLGVENGMVAASATYDGVVLYDAVNPRNAGFPQSFRPSSGARRVVARGDRAYCTPKGNGLSVLDLADPDHPTELGTLATDVYLSDFTCTNDTVYAVSYSSVVHAWKIEEPATLTRLGELQIPEFSSTYPYFDPCLARNHLFLAQSKDRITSIEVTDPGCMGFETALGDGGSGSYDGHICIAGDILWRATINPESMLESYDVSHPEMPRRFDQVGFDWWVTAVAANEEFAVVAGNYNYAIVRCETDSTLTVLSEVHLPARYLRVALDGDVAYLGTTTGVVVCDVSDPSRPRTIGYIDAGYRVDYLEITEDRVMATADGSILIAPRQTDIELPVAFSGLACRRTTGGVELSWTYHSDDGSPGIELLEGRIGGRRWPVAIAALGGGRFRATDVSLPALGGDEVAYYAFVRDPEGRLLLADMAVAPAGAAPVARIASVYPNPANPITHVRLTADGRDRMRVSVYDLSGRLVARLLDAVPDPGGTVLTWDGKDTRGRAAASGTYLVAMETETVLETRKVMLVR